MKTVLVSASIGQFGNNLFMGENPVTIINNAIGGKRVVHH
jgi:hypothetical protein